MNDSFLPPTSCPPATSRVAAPVGRRVVSSTWRRDEGGSHQSSPVAGSTSNTPRGRPQVGSSSLVPAEGQRATREPEVKQLTPYVDDGLWTQKLVLVEPPGLPEPQPFIWGGSFKLQPAGGATGSHGNKRAGERLRDGGQRGFGLVLTRSRLTHLKASGWMGDSRMRKMMRRRRIRKPPRDSRVTRNTFPLVGSWTQTRTRTRKIPLTWLWYLLVLVPASKQINRPGTAESCDLIQDLSNPQQKACLDEVRVSPASFVSPLRKFLCDHLSSVQPPETDSSRLVHVRLGSVRFQSEKIWTSGSEGCLAELLLLLLRIASLLLIGHWSCDVTEQLCSDWSGEEGPVGGDRAIHDRDLAWLQQSDGKTGSWRRSQRGGPLTSDLLVVAEVTQPSLGVGYELGRVVDMKEKKVLCLFRPSSGRALSAMIRGAADGRRLLVVDYSEEQLEAVLARFFSSLQSL
ncbi:hypothetical protein CCH79_00019868 [Gambusia affinis]|uniref:Uncharacterized protein n=1 Tax=Gambusia affinis TaxID=33528 RepID=A0A315VQU9_GAMAF|nr:hypothetical protein CCH79_00019868 [Gambusia affinis]